MNQRKYNASHTDLKDYGPNPLVINIGCAAKSNPNYRTALWTGNHLQVTLMSIPVGGDIGVEMHPNLDQFIRIECGNALVLMGEKQECMRHQQRVNQGYAAIVPAGTWHNIINTGNVPLKLYAIYAPTQHPFGTIQETKKVAEAAEAYK